MNNTEAMKFLAVIKVAYPNAYRDLDDASAEATVKMWQQSFPETPFGIISMAFDNFRRKSKFAPTVAEINEELSNLYYKAMEEANVHKFMDNTDGLTKCRYIMQCTVSFKKTETRINYGEITPKMISERTPYLLGGD
jgi:hypothetical protein